MSKKKAFTGNTMTLKDFHGGSIPSDLPLPSAPGVTIRPVDRSGYDRSGSWGNSMGMGRPDHRARPHSSPATRHFDDKSPFLTHTAQIGRNFDEDERKPLDGGSAPRRTVSDDSFRVPQTRTELRPEPAPTSGVTPWQGMGPVVQGGAVSSYSVRVTEAAHVGMNQQNVGANIGQSVGGPHQNVWAARKEAMGVPDSLQSTWTGQSAAQKLAHASALEKVSSGRWQSKNTIPCPVEIDTVEHLETDSGLLSKGYDDNMYNRVDVVGGSEYADAMFARQMEWGLSTDHEVQVARKDFLDHERVRSPLASEVQVKKSLGYADGSHPPCNNSKYGASDVQSPVPSEVLQRPILKLLPRTKPLESGGPPAVDQKQGYQQPISPAQGHTETANIFHGIKNPVKPGLAVSVGVKQAAERPKLNLRPRSQPQQGEGSDERERRALFGGARPREQVLKERGLDDVAITRPDILGQHSDGKHSILKTERGPEHTVSISHSERTDNATHHLRAGKKSDRKDYSADVERGGDMQRKNYGADVEKGVTQRKNWRNENRTNNERRQQQQLPQERQPSPETWRKPVEGPKSTSDAVGVRHGKAASAVELAQVFSRSFSDPNVADPYSSQRGLPGNTQMPFSRLMDPTARPKINGY
ncbi:hypothetical protein HS088_TW09G00253 [Tripterygium wilfordii]|uniref:Eukaryotic translation initiation factor-related n=1 Tax=Tripterygium wilfordii TaxID=458696 RepID=A0A7J7D759_TRIWF|nr:uncharacterized protein LOC120005006 isoform X2 [Tripterygium wilfordii]KAF5742210.1 hypothetical protein HS088_TW09G00253 [Tripterygium wilfordii]